MNFFFCQMSSLSSALSVSCCCCCMLQRLGSRPQHLTTIFFIQLRLHAQAAGGAARICARRGSESAACCQRSKCIQPES